MQWTGRRNKKGTKEMVMGVQKEIEKKGWTEKEEIIVGKVKNR